MIFLVFLGADMLNGALALSQMPKELADWVTHIGWSPLAIVANVIAMYIVMGFFMAELPTIILTIPEIFPAVIGLHRGGLEITENASWFGLLRIMLVRAGLS